MTAPASDGLPDGFFDVRPDAARIVYHGHATVGTPGRARLHDRDGGISNLIWDGLVEAGWLGQRSGIHPTIEVCIRVPAAPDPREAATPCTQPRPGGPRRSLLRGRKGLCGAVYQRYEGPLHARAVPGIQLWANECRDEDFDYLEDMLYAAAVQAGWVDGKPNHETVTELRDIDILVGVACRAA